MDRWRSVEDAALIYRVLNGPDPHDPQTLAWMPDDPLPTMRRGGAGLRLAGRISRASVELPQPDSPTTPSISSGFTLQLEGHPLIRAPIYSLLPVVEGAVAFTRCARLQAMSRADGIPVVFKNVDATRG